LCGKGSEGEGKDRWSSLRQRFVVVDPIGLAAEVEDFFETALFDLLAQTASRIIYQRHYL